MKAILFISHGSYAKETLLEVQNTVRRLREINGGIIEYAFLEIESPSILEGIDLCVSRGAREIVLLLNFLNSGKHVGKDIPKIIDEAKRKYPQVKMVGTDPVGQHKGMIDLFLDMIHE